MSLSDNILRDGTIRRSAVRESVAELKEEINESGCPTCNASHEMVDKIFGEELS